LRRQRAPDAPVMLVALDASRAEPLHRQVYDGVRDAILHGRLAPGARLPSTRALAGDLGVSRNTVTLAFDQLRAEGYLVGRRGAGTRVRSVVPDALLRVDAPRASRVRESAAPRASTAQFALLSARGARLLAAGLADACRPPGRAVPFRLGIPALDEFPAQIWARLTARRWRTGTVALMGRDVGGDIALRRAIAEYVTSARGARCVAEQVIVVSGTHQALDLVAQVLLDRDDRVWMEDPGYAGARTTLDAAGLEVVPVPVDAKGIDVAAGERLAPNARLAYVTPSHQFPLGAVMSASRRLALLSWARRAHAWIVEDDYDSEFRYAGRPLPCLQGLDVDQSSGTEVPRVLYVGTFGKSLVPGLRLAYLVVPEQLVDAFRAARAATDRHPPTMLQGVLTDFIVEGHYARHVRRVRALYAERQETLVDEVRRKLDGLVSIAPHAAGLHLVGWLPAGVSDDEAAARVGAAGVELYSLSRFSIATRARDARRGLVFGYAGFNDRQIRRGVDRIAGALADLRPSLAG
jgi:GntR family transcriptional regulator/MocR family aminotransferase